MMMMMMMMMMMCYRWWWWWWWWWWWCATDDDNDDDDYDDDDDDDDDDGGGGGGGGDNDDDDDLDKKKANIKIKIRQHSFENVKMLIVSYLQVVYIMETANMEKRYHYKVVPKIKSSLTWKCSWANLEKGNSLISLGNSDVA